MAAQRVIQCQDCGHHVITRIGNTKRCVVCRLVENLRWVASRSSKCWLCDERFAPIARDDKLCGKCALPTKQNPVGACAICSQERPLLAHELAVCLACARDGKQRKKLYAAVLRKQEQRVASDPGPAPQLGDTVSELVV